MSLQTGLGVNLKFGGFANYARILKDPTFKGTLFNTFFYLIVQVPIMLVLALALASMLDNKDLRFKGIFRTCIFLPCATSLVSYAMIFRSMFANDGFVNNIYEAFFHKYFVTFSFHHANHLNILNKLKQIPKFKIPVIVAIDKEKEFIKEHFINDGFKDCIVLNDDKKQLEDVLNKYI